MLVLLTPHPEGGEHFTAQRHTVSTQNTSAQTLGMLAEGPRQCRTRRRRAATTEEGAAEKAAASTAEAACSGHCRALLLFSTAAATAAAAAVPATNAAAALPKPATRECVMPHFTPV